MSDAKTRALAVAAACGLAAGVAQAQPITITKLLMATDPIDGVGNVTTIDNMAVNNAGQWIVQADTDALTTEDWTLVKNGLLFMRENQALPRPIGALISSWGSVSINSAGDMASNIFLRGAVTGSSDTGVYFNESLIIQEGDAITAAGLTGSWIGFFRTFLNDSNQILMVATPSTVTRAVVVISYDTVLGTYTEKLIASTGATIPGMNGPATDFGTTPHEIGFGNNGDAIFQANHAQDAIVRYNAATEDFTVLAIEGGPAVEADRTWADLGTSEVAINNLGGYVFSGRMSGDAATDFVIVKDGHKFIQEGDAPPGIPGSWALTAFGTTQIVQISDAGDVLWYGDWDNPDTTQDNALYWNMTPILVEGVTTVDGRLVRAIASVQSAFAISRNGRFVVAEVTLDDFGINRNAALLIEIGEPACYANCDQSTSAPVLNVADFTCFLQRFAAGEAYANCDQSTNVPVLNVADFTCFLQSFAAGCP